MKVECIFLTIGDTYQKDKIDVFISRASTESRIFSYSYSTIYSLSAS